MYGNTICILSRVNYAEDLACTRPTKHKLVMHNRYRIGHGQLSSG